MTNIDKKLGKRIIINLNSNRKILNSIKDLEKICDIQKNDSVYAKDKGWAREMIVEWAYAGVITSGMNGGNYEKRLASYATSIKKTLNHNPYSDPAFYIPEIFNSCFK